MKTILSLTTAVYFLIFIGNLGTAVSLIGAGGIVLNALVAFMHSGELGS